LEQYVIQCEKVSDELCEVYLEGTLQTSQTKAQQDYRKRACRAIEHLDTYIEERKGDPESVMEDKERRTERRRS